MEMSQLQPRSLWNFFTQLNAIPRASKKEEAVLAWLKAFADERGLTYRQDEIGNIVIIKNGTMGKESHLPVVLQGHVDMVHQKNSDTEFDFDRMGIDMYVDGDWVKARGTTLGADNGIAVATMLALLDATDIAHPPLEALFTVDEEAGMTGALKLSKEILSGKVMLNMDTEEDDEFTIGSAGGVDTTTQWNYAPVPISNQAKMYEVRLRGLQGGHSGMEIHLGLGNANILLAQLLLHLPENGFQLVHFDGGSLRNAIPREAKAFVIINQSDLGVWKKLKDEAAELKKVYSVTDPNFHFSVEEVQSEIREALSISDTFKVLNSIAGCANGVFRLSSAVPGLVETSSNLARIEIGNGLFRTLSLQRSSIDHSRDWAAQTVGATFKAIGATVSHTGHYPGWQPRPESNVLNMMVDKYRGLFGSEPQGNHLPCRTGMWNHRREVS
jgi:dipeptidase D